MWNVPPILLLLAQSSPITQVELVESFPVETTLDHPGIRDTHVVWKEMIDGAKSTLEFAEFYASDVPGSRLGPIVEAVEQAAARGVRVRFLAEKKFQVTYPDTLARLAKQKNVEVHLYDLTTLTGGVLHAKYFVVDGREVYFGSQNFDWRSLEHIQELGVHISDKSLAIQYLDLFEYDWAIARGEKPPKPFGGSIATEFTNHDKAPLVVTPVFSPKDLLPAGAAWDLPRIVELIDASTQTVRVQVLTYKSTDREGHYFEEIENALRRAAARKVQVQLLVADWGKRKGTIEGLQGLEPLSNIEVKLVTIPQASVGFVPFARVVHAKYLVVDGVKAWIGTSNWERDYFHASRNVGAIVEGAVFGSQLDAFFTSLWTSSYAIAVDPCAQYVPPRIGE